MRGGRFRASCARVATEPEGLLGLAIAMILVCGVMAASSRSKGNCKIVGGLHGDNVRVGRRGIDLVHGVGGHGQQELVAGFEEGLEEHVNGFVDAVGEGNLLGARGRDARRRELRRVRARDSG